MRPLHPPLAVIEEGLFGAADARDDGPEEHDAGAAAQAPGDAGVPLFLREAFARREAALRLPSDAPLERGQVRVLAAVRSSDGQPRRHLAQPVGVLLRMQVAGALWRGWLVAPEADYASAWDVVLGERDAPVDPLAAIVQAWNEVSVVVAPGARLLAVLGPERMQAIEAVAAQAQAAGERMPGQAQPGLVALRETPDGFVLATGTALGDASDPRRGYQSLYRRLGREIEEAALAAAVAAAARPATPGAAGGGVRGWWQAMFSWRGAFAAVAVMFAVQTAVLVGVMTPGPEAPVYRGEPAPGEPGRLPAPPARPQPAIRVIFAPDVAQARVQRAIRDVGGQVVAGPNENGEFVVLVRELAPSDAVARLRLAGVIDSAEEVQGGWVVR
jgi:hypothetical protein